MPVIQPKELESIVARIFHAAGAPEDIAEQVSASLVLSDMVGHESHGVVRVRQYLDTIDQGDLRPDARPVLALDAGAICRVDAQRGFGQVAARWTMEQGIERAKAHGIAAAGLFNCGHVGRLGEWVQIAAENEALAMAFCNGGGVRGAVAPFGGASRVLGTNPIAAAIPVAEHEPIVLDFATSAVAEGKVRVARNRGKRIPEGWILDANGQPSTDPNDLYNGGMLLPAATHKGYALSLLVEFLGGLLTASGTSMLPGFQPGNGVLFIVMNIDAFRPFAEFAADGGAVAEIVKSTPTAPGFDEILLPGEPEQRSYRGRSEGVPVDDATWTMLIDAGKHFGLEWQPAH